MKRWNDDLEQTFQDVRKALLAMVSQSDRANAKEKSLHFGNRRQWVYGRCGQVYLRTGARAHRGGMLPSIELASIELHPEYQECGFLTKLLDTMEELSDQVGRMVYVECVIDGQHSPLGKCLLKRGYNILGLVENPANFFRLPKGQKSSHDLPL